MSLASALSALYASLKAYGIVPDAQIPAAIARDSEVATAVSNHGAVTTSIHGFDGSGNAPPQAHSAALVTSGSLDGDRLPALSAAKRGGVPETGTPAGKFLKDDGTWAAAGGGTPASSVTDETTWGIIPAVGVSTNYAREDHTHGSPQNPGGGGESEAVVVCTHDTANATVNLANATDLTFMPDTNSTYIIEVFLLWHASVATVGIKVSATAGASNITAGHFITDATNGTPDGSTYNANDVVVTTSASPFTTYNMGKLDAILQTGLVAANWQLRFAAETTGTITIKAGSVLRYRKVA